jgi:hypothetical protein
MTTPDRGRAYHAPGRGPGPRLVDPPPARRLAGGADAAGGAASYPSPSAPAHAPQGQIPRSWSNG